MSKLQLANFIENLPVVFLDIEQHFHLQCVEMVRLHWLLSLHCTQSTENHDFLHISCPRHSRSRQSNDSPKKKRGC